MKKLIILILIGIFFNKNISSQSKITGEWSGSIGSFITIEEIILKGTELCRNDALDKAGKIINSNELLLKFSDTSIYKRIVMASTSMYLCQVGEKRILYPISSSDKHPGTISISIDYVVKENEFTKFITEFIQESNESYFNSISDSLLKISDLDEKLKRGIKEFSLEEISAIKLERNNMISNFSINKSDLSVKYFDKHISQGKKLIDKHFENIQRGIREELYTAKPIISGIKISDGKIIKAEKNKYNLIVEIDFFFDNGPKIFNNLLNFNPLESYKNSLIDDRDFSEYILKKVRRFNFRNHHKIKLYNVYDKNNDNNYCYSSNILIPQNGFKYENICENSTLIIELLDKDKKRLKRFKVGKVQLANLVGKQKKSSIEVKRKIYERTEYVRIISKYPWYED